MDEERKVYGEATDVVSVDRMLRELGLETSIGDAGDPDATPPRPAHADYDEDEVKRLTAHIKAAVSRVGEMVGTSLLMKEGLVVRVPAPAQGQILLIDLPDFIEWTKFSYYVTDVYGEPVTYPSDGADDDVVASAAAGYPPSFTRSLAARTDRPVRVEVHPNGLGDTLTRQWPAMAPGSFLELTASTGFSSDNNPMPEDLKQAVVLVARAFYDGFEREGRNDAARALCRPYREWYVPDAF